MKTRIMTLSILVVCGLAGSSASALAQSNGNCSNRTLNGNYGWAAEGVLLPAPGVSLQFRSVGMTTFDGAGTATWVEHTVIGGTLVAPGWTAASGTYTVNANCTGTMVINTPNSPVPLVLGFVVVRHGQELHTVLDTDAVSSVYTKVE